jgi:hypothetical protein
MVRLGLAAALVVLAAPAAAATVTASDPASVIGALKADGATEVELGKTDAGTPLINFAFDGVKGVVYFNECNADTHAACQSLQFYASFTPELPFGEHDAMAFMADNRFAVISLDPKDKSAAIDYDVVTGAGLDPAVFALDYQYFRDEVGQFSRKLFKPDAAK